MTCMTEIFTLVKGWRWLGGRRHIVKMLSPWRAVASM